MANLKGSFESIAHALVDRAAEHGERTLYTSLIDGERESGSSTYGQMHARAGGVARQVRARGLSGERVLVLCDSPMEFAAAFFGCLHAGAIAVPCPPPMRANQMARLRGVWDDAAPRAILTTSSAWPAIERVAADAGVSLGQRAAVLLVDELGDDAQCAASARAEDIAFLQYTSGSTSTPKGVAVSHANLVANSRAIAEVLGHDEHTVLVSWLPLFHDMGLIGTVVQSLFVGGRCVLMPPLAFLKRPARWLRAIDRYRATTSGAPNFAYELCLRRIAAEERAAIDLSSWKVAFNGAEPVRPDTMQRFARAFAPSGFSAGTFLPCYGLAEATLMVSGHPARRNPDGQPLVLTVERGALEQARVVATGDSGAIALAACGATVQDHEVAIVDPTTLVRRPDGAVGEIWFSGPSVAHGYWNRPAESLSTFGATLPDSDRRWLRTGDLGFVSGGELYVTGRLKDLIVVHGRNLYPQDLELTAERAHPAVEAGAAAAFSLAADGGDAEQIVLVVEQRQLASDGDRQQLVDAIRAAVTAEQEVAIYDFVFVGAGKLPRTTSGKVRRSECRARYLGGAFGAAGRFRVDASAPAPAAASEHVAADAIWALPPAERLPRVAKLLTTIASRALERAFADVSPFVPLPAQGLDSVRAVQMAHDLEVELGCVVDAAQLLDGGTLLDWATRIAMGAAPRAVEVSPPAAQPIMTTAQRSLAAVERLAAPATPSNLFFAGCIDDVLDVGALRAALARVTERHEALRTTFADDGTVVLHAAARVDLEELQASADELAAVVQAQAEAPFDLTTGPLLRCRIVHAGGRVALLLVAHHLVSDLWSLEIVLDELGACYGEAVGGGAARLPVAQPFSAWAGQQAAWDRSDDAKRAADYWRETLHELPALNVPTDRPRGTRPTYRGALVRQTITEATLAELQRLARESDATLFAVLMTAFQATLTRYSGQRDLVVGYTAQTRGGAAHAGTVGMMINLLPCRATLPDGASFRACVERTAATLRAQAEHARLPTATIFEQVDAAQRSERGLFQAFLAFEQAHLPRLRDFPLLALGRDGVELPFGPLTLRGLPVERSASQFELMLYAGVGGRELQLVLEYNADLFDPPTVERLMRHFGALLRAASATPDGDVALLPMLDDEDVRVQLEELNPTWQGAPATRCLHQIFAATAARVPDRVAVVDGAAALSYRQLDERADALARRLVARGVGRGVPVALLMKPSAEMVVAIVGVLKSGAAYVPLDGNQPPERLRFALADCARAGARLLVADAVTWQAAERLAADAGYELIAIDGAEEAAALPPAARPSDARDLAYVIYTSGSTGTPKGVMNTHRNVVRLLEHCEPVFAFSQDDVWSQFHSYSFDVSVFEIWGALLYGGRLVIVPESTRRAPRKMYELLHEHGVTILSQTPAAFQQLMSVDEPWGTAQDSRLRVVAFAGEALDIPSLRPWMERYEGTLPAMINLYGITETCVHVTHRALDLPTVRRTTRSVVGGPIRDLRLYLLDEHRQLVPQGAPGEIHVVGPGLADGYLGRPGLTAERFVASPFGTPGERMYCSGDLARYTAEGDLEYLGRRDHQVKIRGHRIELGEVQHVLALHPSVSECLVVTRRDRFGALELVAYVACAQPSRELEQQLRRFAGERLPAYAVPVRIHARRAFPLTVNGKVDRRALEAETAASLDEAPHAPELTPCEAALSVLWCEVLGVESAAPSDHFFERGGHSLLATRLTNRVHTTMGVKLPLATLYEHPTLAGLAAAIDRQRRRGDAADREIVRSPDDGSGAPLSFAQERIWIAEQLQPVTALFNVPIALELEGRVDADRLAAALQEVTRRHDVLRSYVVAHKSAPVQVAASELVVEMPLVDLADAGARQPERLAEELRQLARTPIPLRKPPLFRALLVRLAADRHVLAFTVHHLVADLVSAMLLIGEVVRQYAAIAEPDAAAPLPSPRLRYADFARWERQRAEAGGLDAGLQYWRDKLAGADTSVSLAPDFTAGTARRRGALVRKRLPPGLLARIAPVRQRFGCTTYAFLLTAFKILVARYTGGRDVAIGTDVAVREREELRDVVGLFVNQVVLRTTLDGDPTFEEALARVSATLVGALTNAHVPIQLVLDQTGLARVGEQPFRILFDFQSYELPQVEGLPFTMRRLQSDWETAKYDLSIFIEQERGQMAATLEYDTDRFHESTAMRLLAHFQRVVEQAVEHPTRRLSELRLVEADTLQQAASVFNEQL